MISVIIPALDEADCLGLLLRALRAEDVPAEIVVADGGSRDRTVAVARAEGATVVSSAPGRGQQLRAGAAAARGDVLLFLHADSVFPAGGLASIERALAMPHVVGGNFRLVFDGGRAFSRRLTRFYDWMRRRGLYYGDSGIFVRRRVYDSIGGFRPFAVMEDYDFVGRLERCGETCRIDDAPPLVTSSRKFAGRRGWRIVCGWLVIHALFHLGVAPDRLARLYYPDRG